MLRSLLSTAAVATLAAGLVAGCGDAGSSGGGTPTGAAGSPSGSGCKPAPGKELVVLEDDKKLQTVDNIVPAIRTDVANAEITEVLNEISSKLNTADLTELNKRAEIDKEDPAAVAEDWLREHRVVTGS